MLIVLPAVIMRVLYWVYGLITGKKQEPAPQPTTTADGAQPEVKKGTCPYHVVMNFLGFKVPEKKKPEGQENVVNEASKPEDATNQLKTD